MKKPSNLAGAPKSKPSLTAKPVEIETKPVSGLTRQALTLAHQKHQAECEAIGQEASKLEGYLEKDGWKLDVDVMLWFRPKNAGEGKD